MRGRYESNDLEGLVLYNTKLESSYLSKWPLRIQWMGNKSDLTLKDAPRGQGQWEIQIFLKAWIYIQGV